MNRPTVGWNLSERNKVSTENTPVLDVADWQRYAASNKDRCTVCGRRAAVLVTLTSSKLGEGRGALLVKQSFPFCHEHGISRYGNALNRLTGSN